MFGGLTGLRSAASKDEDMGDINSFKCSIALHFEMLLHANYIVKSLVKKL